MNKDNEMLFDKPNKQGVSVKKWYIFPEMTKSQYSIGINIPINKIYYKVVKYT